MSARVSQEMLRALELIKKGYSAGQAAKEVGIHRSTISRSKLYKEYREKLK